MLDDPFSSLEEPFFLIEGTQAFVDAVNAVLNELKEKAFPRYLEATTYLHQAVYDPKLNFSTKKRRHWRARYADGHFGFDGTNAKYTSFRRIFLCAVGYNVMGKQHGDWSKKAANAYAQMVLQELGVK